MKNSVIVGLGAVGVVALTFLYGFFLMLVMMVGHQVIEAVPAIGYWLSVGVVVALGLLRLILKGLF